MPGMTRIVPPLVVAAFVLVVGVAAGSGLLADDEQPDPRPSSTPSPSTVRTIEPPPALSWVRKAQSGCGGIAMRNWSRGVWKCVLSDDFGGDALDLTRWTPVTTTESGFSSGVPPAFACYLYDPRTVSVSGGYLNLSVAKVDDQFLCGGPASQPTKYIGGAVSTKSRVAPTYGRFQIRAKFATDPKTGLQSSLDLLPDGSAYDLRSGEIDIADYFTKWPDRVIPFVRYSHHGDDPTETTDQCLVDRPAAFHTYTLQW